MLLYNRGKEDDINLTLDYFERVSISKHFFSIIEKINWQYNDNSESCAGLVSFGNGIEILYTFDNPKVIKVILVLSNIHSFLRYSNSKEKLFTSHYNLFRPSLSLRLCLDQYRHKKVQTIKPYLQYKRMILPIGKFRIKCFKGGKL